MLSFSFEKKYGYLCKLQAIKDSTRYIVGTENHVDTAIVDNLNSSRLNTGNTSGPRYYTELNLTFEVIGAQCAKELTPQFLTAEKDGTYITWNSGDNGTDITITIPQDRFLSDLDYPFDLKLPMVYLSDANSSGMIIASATLSYRYTEGGITDLVTNTVPLFNISLKNIVETMPISLTYNSEHGLIY